MLPVSNRFLAALRGSHKSVPRARLITPGAEGADPPGRDLVVLGGTVSLDGTADVRGTLDLTIAEPWPTGHGVTNVVPYGAEIAVWRGIEYGNGDVERAPLGIYRITAVEQDSAPDGPLRVTAADRMSGLIESRLTQPAYGAATDTVYSVFGPLVHEVFPSLTVYWDDATWSSPIGRAVFEEEDRHAFLLELVKGLGKIMYFRYDGGLIVKSPPDPSAVQWTVDAGKFGVLTSVRRSLTREQVYNAVVARGEGTDEIAPVVAVVADMDPASPTYWLGPFGKVPRFYTSPMLTTTTQAQGAARSILLTSVGLPYSVDLGALVNPALEPYDSVQVVYPEQRGRLPAVSVETHVVDKVTVPLGPDQPMSIATRLQSLTTNLAVI